MNAVNSAANELARGVVSNNMGEMIVYPAVHGDTRDVRTTEQLDWPALNAYEPVAGM